VTAPVRIPDAIREALLAHARECFPAECCGYLRGAVEAGAPIATELVCCRNAQEDGEHPTHPERGAESGFVIAGRELFDFARSFHTERPAVAVYHSHTNGRAYLSQVDRENARSGDAPAYQVQHVVVGVTASGTTEVAIFAWSDDDRDFLEVARFDARC
jgi:proteasome lid subunit RPN8/RPN11